MASSSAQAAAAPPSEVPDVDDMDHEELVQQVKAWELHELSKEKRKGAGGPAPSPPDLSATEKELKEARMAVKVNGKKVATRPDSTPLGKAAAHVALVEKDRVIASLELLHHHEAEATASKHLEEMARLQMRMRDAEQETLRVSALLKAQQTPPAGPPEGPAAGSPATPPAPAGQPAAPTAGLPAGPPADGSPAAGQPAAEAPAAGPPAVGPPAGPHSDALMALRAQIELLEAKAKVAELQAAAAKVESHVLPLVPRPLVGKYERPSLWTGVEDKKLPRGRIWWKLLESYCTLHHMLVPSNIPNFFGGVAAEWLDHLMTASPAITWAEIKTQFLNFYDPYHADDDINARQRLHANSIRQTSTVRHYAMAFQNEVRIAGGMQLDDQLVLFRFGLIPTIEARCRRRTAAQGGRFSSLDELVEHAAAIETELAATKTPTPTSAMYVQAKGKRPGGPHEGSTQHKHKKGTAQTPAATGPPPFSSPAGQLQFAEKHKWKQADGQPWTPDAIKLAKEGNLCYKCGTKRTAATATAPSKCPSCPTVRK